MSDLDYSGLDPNAPDSCQALFSRVPFMSLAARPRAHALHTSGPRRSPATAARIIMSAAGLRVYPRLRPECICTRRFHEAACMAA